MTGMLDGGTHLTDDGGGSVRVIDMLGAGGQGEVYRVETASGERALKWYHSPARRPSRTRSCGSW